MKKQNEEELLSASEIDSLTQIAHQYAATQYELMKKILFDLNKIKRKLGIIE